jgi:hypothetical protein
LEKSLQKEGFNIERERWWRREGTNVGEMSLNRQEMFFLTCRI